MFRFFAGVTSGLMTIVFGIFSFTLDATDTNRLLMVIIALLLLILSDLMTKKEVRR